MNERQSRKLTLYINNGSSVEDVMNCYHQGMDINWTNENGDTALIIAVKKRRPQLVPWLLHLGADINKLDAAGQSSVHIALKNSFNDAHLDGSLQALLENFPKINTVSTMDGSYPLCLSVLLRDVKLLKKLFICGMNINWVPEGSRPILLIAILSGSQYMCRTLLELGADVDVFLRNGNGVMDALLQYAFRGLIVPYYYNDMSAQDLIELAEILTEYGAKFSYINAEVDRYEEILHYCPPEIFSIVMRHGANIYTILSALEEATLHNTLVYIETIIQHIALCSDTMHDYFDLVCTSHQREYYNVCLAELVLLENTRVHSVPYINILKLNFDDEIIVDRVTRYIIIRIKPRYLPQNIVCYRKRILINMGKTFRQQRIITKAMRILGKLIGIHYETHILIFEQILKDLSLRDLRRICIANYARRNIE